MSESLANDLSLLALLVGSVGSLALIVWMAITGIRADRQFRQSVKQLRATQQALDYEFAALMQQNVERNRAVKQAAGIREFADERPPRYQGRRGL